MFGGQEGTRPGVDWGGGKKGFNEGMMNVPAGEAGRGLSQVGDPVLGDRIRGDDVEGSAPHSRRAPPLEEKRPSG